MEKASKYYIFQQASLSQKVAHKKEFAILKKLSGSDTELSDSIAVLTYLGEKGLIAKDDLDFIVGLLNVLRLSHFATSEKTNEITKMGFMLPKGESEIDASEPV